MNEMTVEEFCDLHRACADGRKWAIENCASMADAWQKLKPDWLIWVATRKGVLTHRELRKFAVRSARQVQHLMTDPRSLKALDVAERYADGRATDEELRAAWKAADAASWAASRAASWAASRAAADASWAASRAAADAARAAEWAAADAARAARAAADATADATARDAARAAWAAAEASQAAWLRANTKPNFGRSK